MKLCIFALVGAVTPVQKVLEMMEDMKAKGLKAKDEENKTYEEYAEWADDQERDKGFQIKTAKGQVEKLSSDSANADSDVETLSGEIERLEGDIATWTQDKATASELREGEREAFDKLDQDYSETLDAVERAVSVLQKQNYNRAQAESLLQTMAKTTPALTRVLAFVQSGALDGPSGAPAVAGYESHSGGVVDMLKQLKKKFTTERRQAAKEEANAAHEYDMMVVNLDSQVKAAKADRNQKQQRRAKRAEQSAMWKGELSDTRADLAADEKYLADMKATFRMKTEQFQQNQKVRGDEIDAIAKAIEIIAGQAVKGGAEKHLPALVEQRALSFLQVSATDRVRRQIVTLLQKSSDRLGSRLLLTAAVKAANDPFKKVVTMIEGLIARLEEEAAAESEHNAFCNEELKKNKLTREQKQQETATLQTEIDETSAQAAKLGQEVAQLKKEEAQLQQAMKKATAQRTTEKERNEATIKDAKAAQEAVSAALQVLKDFYQSAGGDDAAFLQQEPEFENYKGMQNAKGGVMGMLEVIQSDFARLQAQTETEEAEAQQEYEQFTNDSEADAKAKHKEAHNKAMLKDRKEHEVHVTSKDFAAAQEQLDAAMKYYEELKPQCLEVHVSYEERVRLRNEEIQSLKDAYAILDEMK